MFCNSRNKPNWTDSNSFIGMICLTQWNNIDLWINYMTNYESSSIRCEYKQHYWKIQNKARWCGSSSKINTDHKIEYKCIYLLIACCQFYGGLNWTTCFLFSCGIQNLFVPLTLPDFLLELETCPQLNVKTIFVCNLQKRSISTLK